MASQSPTTPLLEQPPVSVRVKLAAAWTSFVLLYAYVDILNFFKPGVIDGIRDGLIWTFDISPAILTIFLVSVAVPAMMVVASASLPARATRVTNLVVASLLVPYTMFNATGETWEWAAFYGISIGLELLLLAFILRTAWTWPHATSPTQSRLRTSRV